MDVPQLMSCSLADSCISLLGNHNKISRRCLNNKTLLSGCWRLEVQDQSVCRAGCFWALPPWLADTVLSPCPHMVFPLCVCVLISSSYKATRHTGLGPTPVTSFYPNVFFEDLSPNIGTFRGAGVSALTYECGYSLHPTAWSGAIAFQPGGTNSHLPAGRHLICTLLPVF